MHSVVNRDKNLCVIYVDMGTTNTRGWLLRGDEILLRLSRATGVRDSAREGSPAKLRTALKELIAELESRNGNSSWHSDAGIRPGNHAQAASANWVAAAGMISSPLGLAELPHVASPAGLAEIAGASRFFDFPDITRLPILLVPGVRCGPNKVDCDSLDRVDVMRGEEVLCLGLLQLGRLKPPGVVLNLGSHWKAVRLNREGQIESSITSLSGELIHAAQTQTILASSLPADRPASLARQWIEAGMKEQRRSGLSRALFSVRLLELADQGTPSERFSFLVGAFISSDLDVLFAKGMLSNAEPVVITGSPAIAESWREVLAHRSVRSVVVTAAETEQAFLAGLKSILVQSLERAN